MEEKKISTPEDEAPHIEENSTIFAFQEEQDTPKRKTRKFGGYGKIIAFITAFCVIVGVAITCTLLFWEVPETEDNTVTTEESITIINKQDAEKITIKNSGAEYSIVKSDDSYSLSGFDVYPIDDDLVTSFAKSITTLSADSQVTGEWSDEQLGLDNPVITVTVDDIMLNVGKTSGMQDLRYCKVSDKDGIYLVSESVFTDLSQVPSDFVNTTVIEAFTENNYTDYYANSVLVSFDDITISGNAYTDPINVICIDNESDVSSFAVTKPKSFYADISVVESLLTPFSEGLTATGGYCLIDDSTDLSLYGLDSPQYIYTYKFGDKTFKIELSKQGVIDDGVYACRVNGGNVIYKVSVDSISFIIENVDELRSTILFSVSIKNVDVFTANYGGKSYSYNIELEDIETDDGTKSESTVVYSMDGEELDTESFQNIYMAIASVSPTAYADDGGELSNEPYLEFELKMTDGSVNTVKFIKYNDRYYRMYLNDIGDQLINYSVVDRLISYFDTFNAGEKVNSPALYD